MHQCIWLEMNKLKLNESKTKIVEVNSGSNITFKINNQKIEKVNQIKHLDFIVDKNLKFRKHIDYICKKIGKNIRSF